MAEAQSWTFLLLMWIAACTNGKTPDVQVTCMFSEDCVLPCLFEPAGDEIIYWFRQNVLIHSFKQGSGLLDQPDQHHSRKTSLFNDTVAFGNASLRIRTCGPQDRGRYRCLVTSSQEKTENLIIVKVEAPIKSVNVETSRLSGYEEVRCSTRGVYPSPRISLFTEPDVLSDGLQPIIRKTADRQGLYTAESKMRKLEDQAGLTYICLVESFYRSEIWRTSLQEKEMYSVEGEDFTIPCVAPWNLQNVSLTWSFTKDHESSIIYTYDSTTQRSSAVWEERVRLAVPGRQSGDGSLRLHSPQRSEHTGIYTCVLSAFQTKHEVHTRVNIIPMSAKRLSRSAPKWIPAAVVTGLAVTAVVIVIVIVKYKVNRSRSVRIPAEATEMQPIGDSQISVHCTVTGDPSESICISEETDNIHS